MKKFIVLLLMAFVGLFTSPPVKAEVKKQLPQCETGLLVYAPTSNDAVAYDATQSKHLQRSFIEDSNDSGGSSPAVEGDNVVVESSLIDGIWQWIIDNWGAGIGLAALLTSILVRWIPTESANLVIDIIGWVIKLVPNRKKGGGTHG